jgi:hypothetical protein
MESQTEHEGMFGQMKAKFDRIMAQKQEQPLGEIQTPLLNIVNNHENQDNL